MMLVVAQARALGVKGEMVERASEASQVANERRAGPTRKLLSEQDVWLV